MITDMARSYFQLRKLLDARRIELRMTMLDVDFDAGLSTGYFAKLVGGQRNLGPVTLGPLLRALKVEITLMPTSVATELKMQEISRFREVTRLAEIGRTGGLVARARYTDPEWSKFCRRAARARWAKRKRKRGRSQSNDHLATHYAQD